MKNNRIYLILYYVSFVLTLGFGIFTSIKNYDLSSMFFVIPYSISILFVVVLSLLLIKKRFKDVNILFPIIYIIFLIGVGIFSYIYYNLLPQTYYLTYYFNFVLVGYLMLNIYSLLCLEKKKK